MKHARLVLVILAAATLSPAADWPMWRHDSGRTAATREFLAENLHEIWSRELPAPAPAYQDVRLRFDAAPEPIVLGKRLFVGSNADDSLAAYDTDSGAELWRFFADGPIRFAPVAGEGRVIFGSDDGCVYCLKASDGSLVWKIRAVPSERRVLGNGRLISVWPVRGGPVLHEGRIYFAAGVWPLEGTFVFCVDAATGRTIWRNDRAAYLYGIHPHNAESFGGIAPQGYLLIDEGDLVVPCSQAYPARFDLATGKLKEFNLPAPGRLPGGWFASTPSAKEEQKLKRRGLLFDSSVNAKPHEDKPRAEGLPEIRQTIRTGEREWKFADRLPGIAADETIHSLIAGDGKLFAVTTAGRLHAYAEVKDATPPVRHTLAVSAPKPAATSDFPASVELPKHGYAVLLGLGEDDSRIQALAASGDLQIVGIDSRSDRVRSARQQSTIGNRVHYIEAKPEEVQLPPYFADLILVDPSIKWEKEQTDRVFESVRPFGGQYVDQFQVINRSGPLKGSANYTGDWSGSADDLVRAPLGLLWFGDSIVHFKRSPQPKFIDGVMISNPKDWTDASTRQGKVDYRLLDTVFSDVYTGRVLAGDEEPALRQSFSEIDRHTIQPSQYRPPNQKDDWKPDAPVAGERMNPLTGAKEPRAFPKSYGCDGGFDYGLLYSMRSGTPAFYDKRIESGTINISGPRSGCTNSVIPANGVLNLPFFYEGCTCAYPLPVALSLVSMPETFEQWACWGTMDAAVLAAAKIQRVGVNFGAPGDRVTHAGLLWLDAPNSGGPSPEIPLVTEPPLAELKTFYTHSLFQKPGRGWPWVAGSGVRGIRSATLTGLKPGTYTVRLTFSEPDETARPGERVFDLSVNGKSVAADFDPLVKAGTPLAASTLEFEVDLDDGTLRVDLAAKSGETVICGIEAVLFGLPLDVIPK